MDRIQGDSDSCAENTFSPFKQLLDEQDTDVDRPEP
ncbi:unnamed protein product, partial [Rotaria magnacalcarata]